MGPLDNVIAIIDYPLPRSMGMLGSIVETHDGLREICGVAGQEGLIVSDSVYESLVAERHVLPVGPIPVSKDASVFWIGTEFRNKAECLSLPLPTPQSDPHSTEGGTFWIGNPRYMHGVLEAWISMASMRVHGPQDREIANLMAWALPDHRLTRASILRSCGSEEERQREMSWFSRVDSYGSN